MIFGKTPLIVTTALGCSLLIDATRADAAPPAAVDETNFIIIVDVTGSMAETSGSVIPGEPPKTRLQVGRLAALDWLINPPADIRNAKNPEWAVWEFSGTSSRVRQDFTTNRSLVLSAIGGTPQTSDATPLAGTFCNAVDRLRDYESTKTIVDPVTGATRRVRIERRIFMVTDGYENNTPNTNECWGPPAKPPVSFPNYTTGSWQWKVYNKLKTGNANTPSTAPFEYIIDVKHLLTAFQQFQGAPSALQRSAQLEGLPSSSFLGASPTSDDVNFFRGVSLASGGTYTQLAPNPSGVVTFKIPGDADSSKCVDMADYDIFNSVYGLPVSNQNVATIQSDFNGDNWVDDKDYQILLQHWGEGCP
ncbi:hypothetical protein [Pendulispora albinea]|uniref:VWFA domain-containing protein n=1 Tax=Pendulispora albinea TaxID=2741071 RepID=A0ABZ2LYT4_9BACT